MQNNTNGVIWPLQTCTRTYTHTAYTMSGEFGPGASSEFTCCVSTVAEDTLFFPCACPFLGVIHTPLCQHHPEEGMDLRPSLSYQCRRLRTASRYRESLHQRKKPQESKHGVHGLTECPALKNQSKVRKGLESLTPGIQAVRGENWLPHIVF